ncbi:A disintegrin and metalloproteinase with thrombospondin motifs 5-like [Plakobranchus ocellatus]|uniref:A disintegrin and metalloproteinase with thrombospondin motifs 5-like n=1 Tax=Plakobranchus ocellatus TaxID=259542 RepID=A0AAV4CDT7_9GAST|nr:A disintegrin and metalloproteinase with thrombospondin motifs 5-like [Plakobranchus ocellatus]
MDQNLRCVLPLSLLIKIETSHVQKAIEIQLVKSAVLSLTSRHVKIMKRDADGVTTLHHPNLHDSEILDRQAYHNHSVGASLIISCIVSTPGLSFLRMEGSVYIRGMKFRLSPFPLKDTTKGCFACQDIAVTCSITPVLEHTVSDAVGMRAPDKPSKSFGRIGSINPSQKVQTYHPLSYGGQHRYRRNTQNFYIDILPIVDYSLYARWLAIDSDPDRTAMKITSYLINILTAVDMRLQTLSLTNFKLNVRMVTPVISTEAQTSPYTESIKLVTAEGTKISAPSLLETFNNWVTEQTTFPKHDHAMLFTS